MSIKTNEKDKVKDYSKIKFFLKVYSYEKKLKPL